MIPSKEVTPSGANCIPLLGRETEQVSWGYLPGGSLGHSNIQSCSSLGRLQMGSPILPYTYFTLLHLCGEAVSMFLPGWDKGAQSSRQLNQAAKG